MKCYPMNDLPVGPPRRKQATEFEKKVRVDYVRLFSDYNEQRSLEILSPSDKSLHHRIVDEATLFELKMESYKKICYLRREKVEPEGLDD